MANNKEISKVRLTDRPLFGAMLLVFTNLLAVAIVFVVNDFALISANLASSVFFGGMIVLALTLLLMNVMFLATYISKRKLMKKVFICLHVIFLLVAGTGVGFYYVLQGKINSSLGTSTDVTSFILVESKSNSSDNRIGVVAPKENTLNSMKKLLVKDYEKETVVSFENYSIMIDELVSGRLEYALLPSNYKESLASQNKLLSNLHDVKTYEINTTTSSSELTKTPFSVVLYGVNEGLPDSIMLLTVNPLTLKITMTSIPRDSYVPIACMGYQKDKLNHSAGVGGLSCTTETIENMFGIKVDYHASINFDGIIDLVDAMNGLELTVDHDILGEYYSDKKEGPTTVFVPKGTYVLTGEQVLTFVRERYSYIDGDFSRQKNQQYALKEIVKKMMTFDSATRIMSIIDTIGQYLDTNIRQSDILSMVNFALTQMKIYPLDDIGAFRVESSRLTGVGDGPYAYSPAAGQLLSVIYVYHQSLLDNLSVIKGNLSEVPEKNESHTLSFDKSEPYVPVHYKSIYDSYFEWE